MTVKVIALILVHIVGGWDIRGHCHGYCTDMGESRVGISEDTVEVIALLLVNIGWVGMSEDAVQVIALILVNIVWVEISEDLSRLLHQHW